MKWLTQLARQFVARESDQQSDAKYERAMRLADEVTEKVRESARAPNPFKSVVTELVRRGGSSNPRLIADAYEAMQESRIYLGPPNGRA